MARLVSFPNSFISCHSTFWRKNSYRQNTHNILRHLEFSGNPLLVTSQSWSQSKILRVNEMENDFFWTFAYGANMSQDTLTKRGVSPSQSMPAVLADHYVAFNHRGVAYQPRPDRCYPPTREPSKDFLPMRSAHGVVHRITEQDLTALKGYEVGYKVRILEVTTYSGECIQAKCFLSMDGMRTTELAPTTNYLRLLQQGAKMRNLDADYVAWLESLPSIDSMGRTPDYFATPNDIIAKLIVGLLIVAASLLYFAFTRVRL